MVDNLDVAVVHDTAFERGGGMRVVEAAAQVFDADLYVGMVDEEVIDRSPLGITRLFDRRIEDGTLRGLYFMRKFRDVPELHEYDAVIQSGSGTHWYRSPTGQRVIRYVHSVPLSYKREGIVPRVSRRLRKSTLHTADALAANSEPTRDDVREYWGMDPEVVYPPVDVDSFEAAAGQQTNHVMIARLIEGKGVREVVKTYNGREEDLTIIGDGPILDDLKSMAAANITFTGYASEAQKRELLREAGALILNSGNESFGIVPIEAMASGTPVIAKRGGYTPHQIDDGHTGLLYDEGKLGDALDRFAAGEVDASTKDLVDAAREYGMEQFKSRLEKIIKSA